MSASDAVNSSFTGHASAMDLWTASAPLAISISWRKGEARSRGHPFFLVRPTHHDLERIIGQGPLQRLGLIPQGARIQTSRSLSVVRITGIALLWIGATTAFGAVVRKP